MNIRAIEYINVGDRSHINDAINKCFEKSIYPAISKVLRQPLESISLTILDVNRSESLAALDDMTGYCYEIVYSFTCNRELMPNELKEIEHVCGTVKVL